MSNTKVDIRRIKNFAAQHIPRNHALFQVLLMEQDMLDPVDFVVKIDVWLKLSRVTDR